MGFKLNCTHICPLEGNHEEELIIRLEFENRAAIHGVVIDHEGHPVEGAVVKLFKKCPEKQCFVPVTFTFTDHCGQFLFGVCSETEYIIKVFFYEPEEFNPPHEGKPCGDKCNTCIPHAPGCPPHHPGPGHCGR